MGWGQLQRKEPPYSGQPWVVSGSGREVADVWIRNRPNSRSARDSSGAVNNPGSCREIDLERWQLVEVLLYFILNFLFCLKICFFC